MMEKMAIPADENVMRSIPAPASCFISHIRSHAACGCHPGQEVANASLRTIAMTTTIDLTVYDTVVAIAMPT